MAKRHPNHRLVKIHRSYTVEEAALLLGKHKNTVRNWVKDGLAPIDAKRPMLILGCDLVEFIKKCRAKTSNPANRANFIASGAESRNFLRAIWRIMNLLPRSLET